MKYSPIRNNVYTMLFDPSVLDSVFCALIAQSEQTIMKLCHKCNFTCTYERFGICGIHRISVVQLSNLDSADCR